MTELPASEVHRIVVLRPSALGDFVFALPLLRALKRRFPAAELVYLGRPWHVDFLAGRGLVDRVVAMPPLPGIGLPVDSSSTTRPGATGNTGANALADAPGSAPLHPPPDASIDTPATRQAHTSANESAMQRCIDDLRREPIDIAVQAYGGGRHSNPFVASLGARLSVGLRARDAPALDRTVHFAPWQNRRLQLLELAALTGATEWCMGRELEATARDREAAHRAWNPPDDRPLVVIQPGASDPRRRWSARRFAAVADALAAAGASIAINGTAEEALLVRRVVAAMRHPAADLAGRLSLPALCGLLERAALLISNDTGPLHLALALGTPAVGIYWFGNLIESNPLRQDDHRPAVSTRIACPVCGVPNVTQRCPHDASFVDDVPVDEVIDQAVGLLNRGQARDEAVVAPRPALGEAPPSMGSTGRRGGVGPAAPSAPYPSG